MNNQKFTKISNKYYPYIKNKNIKNKKLAICFSGVPGSGKTSIAKILEDKYKAVRINKDDIGKIINSLNLTNTNKKEDLSYQYINQLISNYPFSNHLIIIDRSIDRTHNETFKILRKFGFKIFIIRIKVSKSIAIKRIKKRNYKNFQVWMSKINKWFSDYNKSGKMIKANINLDDNNLDLEEMYKKLDKELKH